MAAAISKSGWERRCLSAGTANSGVPQKTTRIEALSILFGRGNSRQERLPLALFFQFFDFAPDQVALEHAEVLQEQDAVQVIDFVAEGAGHEVFGANLE